MPNFTDKQDHGADQWRTDHGFRLLAESTTDYAIFLLDPQGFVTTWNPGAARIKGYMADEIVGRHFSTFYSPDDIHRGKPARELQIAAREGRYEDVGWRLRKDGSQFWASVVITALRDENGELIGYGKVTRDLTELAHLQALAESEQRYRQLAEALPQLVWTCEPDGQCDYLSRQWVQYTGRPEAEQLGFNWLESLHPDDRRPTVDAWREAVRIGTTFDTEFRIRRFDGEYRWFKTRGAAIIDGYGKVLKWFGSCTDIEDEKRATAAERERSEQLEQAIREIHHRIKNNLQAVTSLLQMHLDEGGDSVSADALQNSLRQIKTIALVHDLLSRDHPIGEVDAAKAIRSLIQLLETSFGTSGGPARIKLESEPLLLPTKAATALALVVNELVTNALKHGRSVERGSEGETDAIINVRLWRADGLVHLSVRDEGPGFSPDFDAIRDANIGLELVNALVRSDLQGRVAFDTGPGDVRGAGERGGRVEVVFPERPQSE